MWPESSPVNAVNLVKKICYNSRDIEFFPGDYFFDAPCRYDFEYENFVSLSHQYIQGYYWSVVSREDIDKAQALLELFIRSGPYQFNNFSNFSVSDVSALIYSLYTREFFLHFLCTFCASSLFCTLCATS